MLIAEGRKKEIKKALKQAFNQGLSDGRPEIATKAPAPGRSFRIGGLVEGGSVSRTRVDGKPAASFRVTDGPGSVSVTYVGILPDLFREGQGVVAMGTLRPDGVFAASEVLAKHDETYMPKEVADALKKSGQWKPGS